jgi:hypothetical protein
MIQVRVGAENLGFSLKVLANFGASFGAVDSLRDVSLSYCPFC